MNKIKKSRKVNSRFDLDRKRIFAKSKRSQHEMVGFVLIVVIVVIIGLFLLVFYIRQPAVRHDSLSVQNFLQSAMPYTTDCVLSIEPSDMESLIKSCYKNDRCLNDEMACDILEETLSELVHESWLVSAEKPENAYSVLIYYEEEEEKDEILKIEEGNCTGSKIGAENFMYYGSGNIIISMEVCYT